MSNIILNKTDYLIYRECPKNAWLKIHKHKEVYGKYPPSMFEQMLFDVGNEIDVLARDLFPGGVLLKNPKDPQPTADLIADRAPILYQPVFITDKYKAILDILVWNKDVQAYDIFEVKSSTNGGNKTAKERDYVYDLAFQLVVLQELHIPVNKTYLVRLDSKYVRGTELDIQNLFIKEDFSELVKESLSEVAMEMLQVYKDIQTEEEPRGPCACLIKGRNSHCTTFKYSNPDVPAYSVHDISRIGSSKKKLAELIDSGILDIKDVPEDFKLSEIQRNQVDAIQTGKITIHKAEIEEFLSQIQYPISFIDYETFPAAIPRFPGYSPFNQIPFQFSLHILKEESSALDHDEFIFPGNTNPDLAFIKALEDKLPATGSIIVWNKSFEMGINNKLALRNPQYANLIESINERVIDLLDIFRDQFYVHPSFKGKTSIKYVLPALAPELSYKTLGIQEGATASNTWNQISLGQLSSQEEVDQKIKDLLEYCKLDTYAMYAIWQHCLDKINE